MDGSKPPVAFALGGLAGNNAHGAGFLQAALDEGVEPEMISCTSGQIRWVYQYLRCLAGQEDDLRRILERSIARTHPGFKTADFIEMLFFGVPGVLRSVWYELPFEYLENAAVVLHRIYRAGFLDLVLLQEMLKTLPCRVLAPDAEAKVFYEKVSKAFNDENRNIGIVFNSFNPVCGVENVYLNDTARDLLTRGKRGQRSSYAEGTRSSYRERTSYQEITPDAVRDGLWLYNYGFDPEDRPAASELFVDGAYFRGIILNELAPVRRIYVARPINYRWMGRLPTNLADLADLFTEMIFNGTYDGERHQIQLINKLLTDRKRLSGPAPDTAGGGSYHEIDLVEAERKWPGGPAPDVGDGPGAATDDGSYHEIELVEVEIQQPRGLFDYVFEDMSVFDEARRLAREEFRKHGDGGGGVSTRITGAATPPPWAWWGAFPGLSWLMPARPT